MHSFAIWNVTNGVNVFLQVSFCKGKAGSLPSHQLLLFLASIYFDPASEPLISQRIVPKLYPSGHRVGFILFPNEMESSQ